MARAGGEWACGVSAGSTLQNVIDNEMASSNGRPVACSIPPGMEAMISGVQFPCPPGCQTPRHGVAGQRGCGSNRSGGHVTPLGKVDIASPRISFWEDSS